MSELRGKCFSDVAEDLYDQLLRENRTIPEIMKDRGNLILEERRAGLVKFFYLRDNLETPISKSEFVLEFYINTGVNQVLFFVDVIGGPRTNLDPPTAIEEYSHFQFVAHAKKLLADPTKHGKWKLREFEPNRFRLIKTVRDRYRRTITIVLQPNVGYPKRPPRVVTIPRHRDPCFQNGGELDWTIVKSTGQFTWELYVNYTNPLVYLLDELRTKYRLVF